MQSLKFFLGTKQRYVLSCFLAFFASICVASEHQELSPTVKQPKVKYKASKEIDFEQLLIQGQLKRPELTVVTGNSDQGTDGLLRLRENFLDRISVAQSEEIQ